MKTPKSLIYTCVILLAASLARAQEEKFDPGTLREMAQRGNPDAQFELGLRLLGGEGLDKNVDEAAKWLDKAAAQEHPGAMNAMGTLTQEGMGLPKDEKKAIEWFEKSAKSGFPLAEMNLSEAYESGKGVEKNETKAAEWLEKAAKQEFPQAQAAFAWKLEHGQGVTKDTPLAASWYLKAAQQGLVAAQTHLAYMYYTGEGVPLDYGRAEAWYRFAARSDDPWAHNDLAWFLATCPDLSHHDAETAIEFARSAGDKLKGERYEVVDTLAAALARAGKFGEAVQTQLKAIVMLDKDKSREIKPEERAKLEKELSDRLSLYKKQHPYSDDEAKPEAGTKPMIDDRILQEQELPRKKKHAPKGGDSDRPVVS
ncbi:MAG TPA: tetratricopeptide repeat protein [Verrucomicrobiaceae bacterium]|jgi:TPR repeat protein